MDEWVWFGWFVVVVYIFECDKEKNFVYGVDEDMVMVVNNKD